jgi:hypothetical protein
MREMWSAHTSKPAWFWREWSPETTVSSSGCEVDEEDAWDDLLQVWLLLLLASRGLVAVFIVCPAGSTPTVAELHCCLVDIFSSYLSLRLIARLLAYLAAPPCIGCWHPLPVRRVAGGGLHRGWGRRRLTTRGSKGRRTREAAAGRECG